MHIPHVTDPEFENFPHRSSKVDQFRPMLEDTMSNIGIRFPRNDPF